MEVQNRATESPAEAAADVRVSSQERAGSFWGEHHHDENNQDFGFDPKGDRKPLKRLSRGLR